MGTQNYEWQVTCLPQGCWLASIDENHHYDQLNSVCVLLSIPTNFYWVKLLNVTPLVLELYCENHTGSLNNPKSDTRSGITNSHSEIHIGSSSRIVYLLLILAIPDHHINESAATIKWSLNKWCISVGSVMVAGSLFAMVSLRWRKTSFAVADRRTILSRSNGSFLMRWGVINIRLTLHFTICRVI